MSNRITGNRIDTLQGQMTNPAYQACIDKWTIALTREWNNFSSMVKMYYGNNVANWINKELANRISTDPDCTTIPKTVYDGKGCNDTEAINYNPLAITDDGTCLYVCKDGSATNYNKPTKDKSQAICKFPATQSGIIEHKCDAGYQCNVLKSTCEKISTPAVQAGISKTGLFLLTGAGLGLLYLVKNK